MAIERIIKSDTHALNRKINAEQFKIFKARALKAGYTEDANGNLIGRNALTGLPAPHKNTIKRWDEDGKTDVDGKPYVKELPDLTTAELAQLLAVNPSMKKENKIHIEKVGATNE